MARTALARNRKLNDHVQVTGYAERLFGIRWITTWVVEGNPNSKSNPTPLPQLIRDAFDRPLTGNVFVICIFYRSNRQRIDADNLIKKFLDSGKGICWVDDSQVTAQLGIVEFDAQRPRTVIGIGEHRSSMVRTARGAYTCASCGKGFRSNQHRPRFCSRSCSAHNRGKGLMALVACAWCSREFKRQTSAQRFCGNACRLASLHAGTRAGRPPWPTCRSCEKRLSKRGYELCRACWLSGMAKGQPESRGALQ